MKAQWDIISDLLDQLEETKTILIGALILRRATIVLDVASL